MQAASAFVAVSLALEQPCGEKNAIRWLSAFHYGQQHPQLGKIRVSLLSTNMKKSPSDHPILPTHHSRKGTLFQINQV